MREAAIIHHAVPLIALELGGSVEEILAEQIGVRPGVLDGVTNSADDLQPDLGWPLATEHVGHVDTPAVSREGQAKPAPEDRLRVLVNAATQLLALVVQFGQRPDAEPSRIVIRSAAESEELRFRRGRIGQ